MAIIEAKANEIKLVGTVLKNEFNTQAIFVVGNDGEFSHPVIVDCLADQDGFETWHIMFRLDVALHVNTKIQTGQGDSAEMSIELFEMAAREVLTVAMAKYGDLIPSY